MSTSGGNNGPGGIEAVYFAFDRGDPPATLNDVAGIDLTPSLINVADYWLNTFINYIDLPVDSSTPTDLQVPTGTYYVAGVLRFVLVDASQDGKFADVELQGNNDANGHCGTGVVVGSSLAINFAATITYVPADIGETMTRFTFKVRSVTADLDTAVVTFGGGATLAKLPTAAPIFVPLP